VTLVRSLNDLVGNKFLAVGLAQRPLQIRLLRFVDGVNAGAACLDLARQFVQLGDVLVRPRRDAVQDF
jgi:hypothetical protein